jgi:hypothetical protein
MADPLEELVSDFDKAIGTDKEWHTHVSPDGQGGEHRLEHAHDNGSKPHGHSHVESQPEPQPEETETEVVVKIDKSKRDAWWPDGK